MYGNILFNIKYLILILNLVIDFLELEIVERKL